MIQYLVAQAVKYFGPLDSLASQHVSLTAKHPSICINIYLQSFHESNGDNYLSDFIFS